MANNKPENVGDLNFGEGLRVQEGQVEKGISTQPTKPENVRPPQNLPIPPAAPTNNSNKK